MKHSLLITLAVATFWTDASLTHAAVLFTEEYPVTYGEGTPLGANQTIGDYNVKWPNGNSTGSGSAISTSAGALTYATLAPITNVPSYGMRISTSTSRVTIAPFPSQSGDGTSVYWSFLIKVTADTPVQRILGGLRNSTGTGNLAAGVGINASRQLQLYKNSSSASATHPTALSVGETYLVVLRLRFQAGSDEVALWVNPTTGTASEDAAGVSPTTTTANSDQSSVVSLQLLAASDASGPLYLDEHRVTTTWAEAVPAAGPAIPAKLGFTSPRTVAKSGQPFSPIIVQVQTAGGLDAPVAGTSVTLALSSGSGTLSGTLTRTTDANGRAVFDDLSVNALGPKVFIATAPGLESGTSANYWVIPDPDAAPGGGAPVITQAVAAANNLVLRGRDGAPNGQFRILSATNVTLPMNLWSALVTNNFDANGAFAWTNPIVSGGPRFFRVEGQGGGGGGSQWAQVGYAGVPAPITGGGDTTNIIIATNLSQFIVALSNPQPAIIYIEGTVTLRTNGNTYVGPNKSIIGLGTNATLIGNLGIFLTEGSATYNATNIIIRNLTMTNPNGYGEDDCITLKNGGRQVWIDHCTFYDALDGLVDATREADFLTVSWSKFYYTAPNGHENVHLIGGSDSDTSDAGKLHVTLHHNWYGDFAKERMPSVRFGRAHVFNNYFNSPGNNYCVRTRLNAEVLVENNHFQEVQNPWELIITSGTTGKLRATGNITNNCTFTTAYAHNTGGTLVLIDGSDVLTPGDPLGLNPPPYAYTLDPAANVANLVTNHAGAGRGPFAY